MGKKKDKNQELEQHARGRVQTLFSGWVVNSLEEDYAFDFEVRLRNRWTGSNAVTPTPFFVQLKASRRFDDPDTVWWDLETEYLLDDCLEASVPVILLIYERLSDEFNWCVVQRYCWDNLDENRDGWREQSSVRVKIERDPLDGTVEPIRNAVGETQRRLSMREHIATARRPAFERSAATTLATSEEVSEYKSELVDEALHFVERDRAERAREKLMQVYQMPEDDVPTVTAIQQLLELRTTDDPGVAFGKVRLAIDGLRLAAKYGLEDRLTEFESEYEKAREYIAENFVGARYAQTEPRRELLVLDVSDWGRDGHVGPWIARIQYGVGELGDQPAEAIVTGDEYVLVESGEGNDPLADACEDRNHDFDREVLRDAPELATCTDCGLSRQVVRQLLSHDVPSACDDCGGLTYDPAFEKERPYCTNCT